MEYIVDNLLYIEEIPEKLVSAISTMYSNVQLSKLNLTPEEIASISPNFEFELKQTEEKEPKKKHQKHMKMQRHTQSHK